MIEEPAVRRQPPPLPCGDGRFLVSSPAEVMLRFRHLGGRRRGQRRLLNERGFLNERGLLNERGFLIEEARVMSQDRDLHPVRRAQLDQHP